MASNQCIIDDRYCLEMASYFKRQGECLDRMISDYISVMEFAKSFGTRDGEVHDAMEDYIDYAKKLKGRFEGTSKNVQSQVNKFLTQIDEADQYLF